MSSPKRIIALSIKEAAEEQRMSLVELVVASKVPYGTLEPLWHKRRFNTTTNTLVSIAQVLDVSVDSLLVFAEVF